MKKTILYALAFSFLPLVAFAQTKEEIKEEAQTLKTEIYSNYSRWSVSLYGGVPFMQGGDMITLAKDKTRIGYTGGLQLGYQMTPWFGMSLSGQYGMIPGGAKEVEVNYMIKPTGMTDYVVPHSADAVPFKDLYAEVKAITAGLHFDLNLAALLSSSENRKVALVLSPAVYMQKFSPELKKVADDKKFNTSDLKNDPSLGLGGDLDFRFRTSKHIDLMLKAGTAWVTNNNFDGVDNTGSDLKYGFIGHAAIGLVWKLGNSEKTDNLIYAPGTKRIRQLAGEKIAARLEAERIAREKAEAERLAREKAEAERLAAERAEAERLAREKAEAERRAAELAAQQALPELPTVHFRRGSARIDTRKYAAELETITTVLKEKSTVAVELLGFCDHTGTERINDKLSQKRAEALKKYLVEQGIDESRLMTRGMGVDESLSGKDAYSVKARRVEVTK